MKEIPLMTQQKWYLIPLKRYGAGTFVGPVAV